MNNLEWLVFMTEKGYCPNLIYDDNGHWAISMCSYGYFDKEVQSDITVCIEPFEWSNTIEEAFEKAQEEFSEYEDEYLQWRKKKSLSPFQANDEIMH